jgi:Divergent InlB B-repeat domain
MKKVHSVIAVILIIIMFSVYGCESTTTIIKQSPIASSNITQLKGTYQLVTSATPTGGGTISPSGGPFQGSVTLVATPAQYYEFSGWAGAASGTTNPLTITMNSDKQIVAQFTRIQYTVQVTSNIPNGGTTSPSSGTYDAGTTITLNAMPVNGYRFANWDGDATGNTNPLNILVNSNKNITASFIAQYTLAITANPTEYNITPIGGIFDSGTVVPLTASLSFPYAFKNWTGTDNNNINPTTVTINSNASVSLNVVQCVEDTTQTASSPIAQSMGFVPTNSIPIQLKKGEWIQLQINTDTSPLVYADIKDPNGNIVKDFGAPGQASFAFSAQITGPYTITFQNNTIWVGHYNLSYNIYHLP